MTHQPDDLGEAYAEIQQEGLSVLDEDSLTANTDELNRRQADEAADPLAEQPDEDVEEGADDGPQPPSATGRR